MSYFFFNINNTEKMKKKSVLVIDGKINIYFFSNFNRNLRQYKNNSKLIPFRKINNLK